ncbi:type II secretion system protein [Vibrio aquaticus]|uniref:Type II secretion system protein n=1 Tax=Vibrio aquaticus TaxID=2496559 RepID=A0A3S0MQP9_9VIBR|nr:type II secretion system protein [Vibrio aquaticus]RTZ17787.1 type II secretion system protein [Vibrio aquaticus]
MKRFIQLLAVLASVVIVMGCSSPDQDELANEQQQVVEELQSMLNAAVQYQKDTGQPLPITSDTDVAFGYLAIDDLIEDPGIEGWQGPYLPYNNDWFGFEQYVSHPDYIAAQLLAKEEVEWSKGSTPEGCSETSSSCRMSACIWSVPEAVAKGINEQLDGVINDSEVDKTGMVRFEGGLVWIVCMVGDDYSL